MGRNSPLTANVYYSIVGCGIYYWLWIDAVPRLLGYRIRQEVLELDDGAQSHTLIKVPVNELERWEETHDAVGRLLSATSVRSVEDEKLDGSQDVPGPEKV